MLHMPHILKLTYFCKCYRIFSAFFVQCCFRTIKYFLVANDCQYLQ